jgi:hypothetical protein
VLLKIRKSKNDQTGKGAVVAIVDTSSDGIKLLDRVEKYSKLRLSQGAKAKDPYLVKWDMDSYCLSNTGIKTGQALAQRLRTYLLEIKQRHPSMLINPDSYGMHSLRRGGVTAAWAAGIDMERLKAHGRWRSDAIRTYLQATLPFKLSVTLAM